MPSAMDTVVVDRYQLLTSARASDDDAKGSRVIRTAKPSTVSTVCLCLLNA